jgi:tetratricopeptide (TPR) repeat protein
MIFKRLWIAFFVVLLLSFSLIAILVIKGTRTSVESVGYQFATRSNVQGSIANAAPQGYSSLNPQSFFGGRQIARNLAIEITRGKGSDIEKIVAINTWTKMHIRSQNSGPTTIFQDDYLNIMKRGWGYCDQIAHVFATLATYAGLEAAQLQLFRNDGVSPHTLAVVKIDGKWRVVLTWRGVVPTKDNGTLYSVNEFADLLEKTPSYQFQSDDAELFRNSVIFKTFPYIDNITFAKKVVNRVVLRLKTFIPSSPSSPRSPSSPSSPSSQATADELSLLDQARTAQLQHQFPKAETLYRKLEIKLNNKVLFDANKFYLALLLFDEGKYREAEIRFKKIYQDPTSAWQTAGGRMLAETEFRLNRTDLSIKILEGIDTIQAKVRVEEIRKLANSN